MTKWWRCDLQVATPAWSFRLPSGASYDLTTDDGQREFADRYMSVVVNSGIEVVALADHNTGSWIDVMVAAGERHGVAVFPGCEITTGSGADGIHVVVLGDRTATSLDFDRLLAGSLGYHDPDNPRYHLRNGKSEPGSSGKTIVQILDTLPDDYLAFAPHAFGDNGIASGSTVKGDIRWKAIHHHRLNALDPGDCSGPADTSFKSRFRRRAQDDYPRLKELAFISTSDAYELDELGSRFTWIRMEDPSLEGLRQAFLDHEARILCDWDPRLADYPERNPNEIRHAWIDHLALRGALGNSNAPMEISFDPRLNVLIGGRGSGKSTIVAAIRQLYSGFSTLPDPVRDEAVGFSSAVFASAALSATHHVQNSQEAQVATWSASAGPVTRSEGTESVPTSFRVRVVNQKELFARVSHDREDRLGASRSLLSFADESLGLLRADPLPPDSWWRRFDDALNAWMTSARQHRALASDVAQLPALRARIRDLAAQVAAFDSPEAKGRRERNEVLLGQKMAVDEREGDLVGLVDEAKRIAATSTSSALATDAFLGDVVSRLDAIGADFRANLAGAVAAAATALEVWRKHVDQSAWMGAVRGAASDEGLYVAELQAKGIDPSAYGQLKSQLADLQALDKSLRGKESDLKSVATRKTEAWRSLVDVVEGRRRQRRELLRDVAQKSGRLKFDLRPHRDATGWARGVRELLNLRADAFLEDVPKLAEWLWQGEPDEARSQRWAQWRDAITGGSLDKLASQTKTVFRSGWQRKLESLDETLRLRLAVEIADDVLEMQFLKDGGDPGSGDDWQDITQGSPGQRTAAMLAFVLHHGSEPLVLDQPEDDLDTEWISSLVVRELRDSRSRRQIIVATHNANIPVNGDAERVIVLENQSGALRIRRSGGPGAEPVDHTGAIEVRSVREDIQNIMEGGIRAFVQREKKYNNELRAAAGQFAGDPEPRK